MTKAAAKEVAHLGVAHQCDSARPDPLGDDRGHCPNGSGTPSWRRFRWPAPANPTRWPRSHSSLPRPVVVHDRHGARSDWRQTTSDGRSYYAIAPASAVICEPVRTPIGRYGGMFKSLTAVELGVAALMDCSSAPTLRRDAVQGRHSRPLLSEHGGACDRPLSSGSTPAFP